MSSETRPPSCSLSWSALLSLPMRICNPPPAASRVRSCKVTPLVKVTLDDVLNRRHLPPLTLKDFEEWLVFVEGSPQYLYFILWLKEYESRYAAWLADSGCTLPAATPTNSTTTLGDDVHPDAPFIPRDRDLSYINLIPSSAPLALFFTRAKQTFLDPTSNSPYSLGHAALITLSPSTHSLAPSIPQFTAPKNYDGSGYAVGSLPPSLAAQPHPHPKELAPLAIYAHKILKECLKRFAETACQNVGTRRAWCGIAGGTFITLVIGILPALAAFFFAPGRWWRAVGLFGCWLGGTIIISSFHGICMMIYVFGDLRQLRSFELARPPISGPRAIARARPKLRSFFTRKGEEETGTGNHETGTEVEVEDPAQTEPSAPASARNRNPSSVLQNAVKNRARKKPQRKRPWSAGFASQTSTGTPVVHLGADAFKLGTGTTESETSAITGNGDIIVGETNGGETQPNEDDFGIEISPAYYYSGHEPEGEGEKTEGRECMRSAGSGNKIGLVIQWVLGRRGSVDIGMDTEGGTKGRSVVSEKSTQLQSQIRSHAGTFGIRSWRGRLGCLPEDGCGIEGPDLENGIKSTQTVEDDEQPLHEPEVLDEDTGVKLEDMLTAEFITHDYPELEPQQAVVLGANPELTRLSRAKIGKEKAPVDKKCESSCVSPVEFDFNKLPTAVAARRMSSPCTFAPSSISPCLVSDRALTTPEPMLLHPTLALYSHPGARLTTPIPALSVVIPSSRPISTAKDRQWWDTCPKHPAVETTLASRSRSSTLAVQTHNLPRSSPFLSPIHPASMLTLTNGNSSTRPTSPASSDVHSRMRASVPTASTHKSVLHSSMSFSSRNSETWQTRFRRVMAVPAFGPLTRVLEPIVSRGQWEIVVRSACAAVLGAWIVIGCLVALPGPT